LPNAGPAIVQAPVPRSSGLCVNRCPTLGRDGQSRSSHPSDTLCRIDQLPTPIAWGICSCAEMKNRIRPVRSACPRASAAVRTAGNCGHSTAHDCFAQGDKQQGDGQAGKYWHICRRVADFPRRRGGKWSAAARAHHTRSSPEIGQRGSSRDLPVGQGGEKKLSPTWLTTGREATYNVFTRRAAARRDGAPAKVLTLYR
jgi:hypothetical protein